MDWTYIFPGLWSNVNGAVLPILEGGSDRYQTYGCCAEVVCCGRFHHIG